MDQNYSFINEYREMLDFIKELQESALEQSDSLLSAKKELEYKKRQQEYLLEERKKKQIPNLSMFSPLNTEDFYEEDINEKDELKAIAEKLMVAEENWEKQKRVCQSFERLRNFFLTMEQKMEKASSQVNDNSIDYSTKLIETQEMDRNRISRDLHDSTVQGLTGLGHKMEYCSRLIDKDPVRVKMELQSMIDINKEIINDMRAIIYDLRPMSLNNIGLVSTIESYCLYLRRYNNLDVVFKTKGEEKTLTSMVSVTLYRIIQEACNNIVRHAKAKKVIICISYLEQSMELDIEDNGIGFDMKEIEEHMKEDSLHGFGLSTMKERARVLSGSFSIDTKPGSGTKIHVFVPVDYTSRKEGKSYE